MAFTQAELDNIAAATLDHHLRGVHSSSIQDKPVAQALEKASKPFTGAKEVVTERVKGVYTTSLQGYTHNDTVAYANPANIKQVEYPWKELHAGITVTLTELKANGINVVDTEQGRRTTSPDDAEMVQLVDLLADKLEDMSEGSYQDFHLMLWKDGTQDAKELPGLLSLILDDPAAAAQTVGGLATDTNTWWRNRALLDINTANTEIANVMQKEFRQLVRYAKNKGRHRIFSGSDFLDALEQQLREKGTYTDSGWAKEGGIDVSMGDAKFKGMKFEYDPGLDDVGRAKFCYIPDMNAIRLRPMRGEAWKKHTPARPETSYAIFRALTWTGALTARQLNSSGVYSIA